MTQLQSLSQSPLLHQAQLQANQICIKQEKQNIQRAKFVSSIIPIPQRNFIPYQEIKDQSFVLASEYNLKQEIIKQQNKEIEDQQIKIEKQKNEKALSLQDSQKKLQAGMLADSKRKAQLVRQIQLQIQLLQSKSKQPAIKSNDLQHLGYEIYEKLDQYYIMYGVYKNSKKQLEATSKSFFQKIYRLDKHNISDKAKKSTMRSRSSISNVSTIKNNSNVSRLAANNHEQLQYKNVIKTCENVDFSQSSISQKSRMSQEVPFFETKMSESDLAALDKSFEGQVEVEGIFQNENYLQLKENIRVMEQRIVFLIHRLNQTKTELTEVKEENIDLKQKLKKQSTSIKQLKNQQQILYLLQDKNIEQIDRLKFNLQEFKRKVEELQKLLMLQYKQNELLKYELKSLEAQLHQQQKKYFKVSRALQVKIEQFNEVNTQYMLYQIEEQIYKKQSQKKIEDAEIQNEKLRKTIKDQRSKLQNTSLSLQNQEVDELKQLIKDTSAFHQIQLKKIDKQYSKIIESLKIELEKHVISKKELQNALLYYFGVNNFNQNQQQKNGLTKSTSLIKIMEKTNKDEFTNNFVSLIQQFKQTKNKFQCQKEMIEKLEDKIQILKQDSQEKFETNKQNSNALEKKVKEIEELRKENEELKIFLRQNLTKKINKNNKDFQQKNTEIGLRKSKIQSKIIEISLFKQAIFDQSELTLQSFIRKKIIVSISSIIRFGIKLINFSEELQETHKRKLPSLAPHSVLLRIKKLKDLDINFSVISKKEEEQGLMYQAPQILLGFAESAQSHCWTIGVIVDEMLHGRKFFKSFSEILLHKDNYSIQGEKFKNIEVLCEMLRKSHKQRKNLFEVKCQLQNLDSVFKQK